MFLWRIFYILKILRKLYSKFIKLSLESNVKDLVMEAKVYNILLKGTNV